MGVIAIRARFDQEPPTSEVIDRELRAQAGAEFELTGCRRDGMELAILIGIDDVAYWYTVKVLRSLGGTVLDFSTREPTSEPLPAFVSRPWLEHDEATREMIRREHPLLATS